MSGFKLQTPVSQLIKTGKGGGGVDEPKTRDSFRREKDLEEDRKLGLEPACVDVDTGRDINPHIPQFITQNPWYVPSDGATLKHQRPHWERQQDPDSGVHDWYKRGQQEVSSKPVKFRAGSCENCGAMTHKKRDCFERPRKQGAKFTNDDIAADDYIQPKLKMGFEAKRDRWNGYDNAAYSEVIKDHEKQEEVRKMIKAEKAKEEKKAAEEAAAKEKEEKEGASADEKTEEKEGSQGEEEDEDLYAEDAQMETKVDMDSSTRITVRNLRIREDTAKYLYNLNENAPYYDPKSRSMRENPLLGVKGKEQQAAKFSGENFVRYSGEVVAANEAQVFAWSARCQGIDVHALAEPTRLEQLQKDFKSESKDVKQETKKKLLEKYGGSEHLEAVPKELLLAQSETYVEYTRKGTLIKGEERPLIKSRYEEDVYPKNHSSIYGSFWANGRWGFRCCHSFVRQSYCIGEQGYAVNDEMAALPKLTKKESTTKEETRDEKMEEAEKKEEVKKEAEESSSSSSSSSDSSSDSEDSDEEREREKKKKEEADAEEKRRAEREQRQRERRREKRKRRTEKMGGKRKRKRHNSESDKSENSDSEASEKEEDNTEDAKLQRQVQKTLKEEQRSRKEARKNERERKYNKSYDFKKPTEVEVEAYQITKVHSADPMAKFIEDKRSK